MCKHIFSKKFIILFGVFKRLFVFTFKLNKRLALAFIRVYKRVLFRTRTTKEKGIAPLFPLHSFKCDPTITANDVNYFSASNAIVAAGANPFD